MIARDSEGCLIEAKALFIHNLMSPTMAEAMAIEETLSWSDRVEWNRVIMEADCLVVVQAIRSNTPMKSYLGLIIEECRDVLQRLRKTSLFFVKRPANMVAHQLVRESYLYSGRNFDRRSVPIEIGKCIDMNLNQ